MAADWDTSGFHDRPHDGREDQPIRRRFDWLVGGRRRLALLTGFVSLAIVGAFIWSGRDRAGPEKPAEPPLIRADEAPIRVPPEDPGGLNIPHRDKLVYRRLPGEGEDSRMERLLPPPEEPLPPPAEQPAQEADASASMSGAAVDDGEDDEAPAADGRGASASLFAPPAGGSAPRSTDAPPARPPRDASASASAHAAGEQGARVGAPRALFPPGTGASSGTSAPTASATPAQPTPQSTPAGGGYMVQLLAVASVDQAQAAWSRLAGRNADILGGLSPSYVRADLGTRGVIYRLRAGPVGGETSARTLCAQLSARNVDCVIVRPGG
ncbi:MAG: SPOR domain-containing protein [Rhodospirillales bacterium]|nr:SPOR domain-containing protein [Rhodospirillales bacterium]